MLGIAGTMPKSYVVERSIEIHAIQDDVFDWVADFSKWKQWSPWFEYEPNATYQYSGEMGMKDSSIRWDGKIVGRGTMTLDKIEPHHHLFMTLMFETPHRTKAQAVLAFEPVGEQTKVTWTNQGDLEYPMGRLFGPFLKDMIGKDILKGLEKLKVHAEKRE
ncbi:MAG: SRPBCC family protein [Bdellovibrionota bacterium]